MEEAYPLLARIAGALAGLAVVILIGMTLEQYLPAERDQPFRSSVFKIKLLVIFTVLSVLLGACTAPLVGAVSSRFGGGWIELSMGDSLTARLAQPVVAVLIFDFFYYWLHRFQHRSWFLWQEHKLHHADHNLNVTTAGLHHWLEGPLRAVFISIPTTIVFDIPPTALAVSAAFVSVWAGFKHANLRISLGPLTPIIVGPQLHRIHHSVKPEHHDRNFAAFFPIYDLLFGTYCGPKAGEWPVTGLPDGDWPRGVGEATVWPFLAWWSAAVAWRESSEASALRPGKLTSAHRESSSEAERR